MNFRKWLLTEESDHGNLVHRKRQSMNASIPMPDEIHILSNLFSSSGAKLYAVGGAIRDYLYHIFHQRNIPYNPKDIDLTTDQPPDQIIRILSSPSAVHQGIRVLPKGEKFGVISAIINGKEFEIATFRTEFYDAATGDGRRPDSVQYSTAAEDAKRRDLHINALFYDLQSKEVHDYNIDDKGEGEGFKDIQNKRVRVVGDPFERFREDKLRVLRLVRFFCRFNEDIITSHLDSRTLSAVDNFKDLKGVSSERIANEFISGLKTCKSTKNYILSFKSLGLIPTIFPGLNVNTSEMDAIDSSRNSIAVTAFLLRDNNDIKAIKSKLNSLKYSNEFINALSLVLMAAYKLDKSNFIRLLRMRDNLNDSLKNSIIEFGKISGLEREMSHFVRYTQVTKSEDYMQLKDEKRGEKMSEDEYENYKRGL